MLDLIVLDDAGELAQAAAAQVADAIRRATRRAGHATFAASGGRSPAAMFDALATMTVDWTAADVLQVDERIAPDGDPDRNWGSLVEHLLDPAGVPVSRRHPMAVGTGDGDQAARSYNSLLSRVAPGGIDVVHLGLGDDGHTASLVAGDAALEVTDRAVAVTTAYRGRRRVTLTLPALAAAGRVVWLVVGAEKASALRSLVAGDRAIPAGRVPQDRAVVCCDPAAAALLLPDK